MGDTDTADKDLEDIDLTPPERKLWRALAAGEICAFNPDGPKADRTVRGDVLGKLLRGEKIDDRSPPCLPRQIVIFGVIISGVLDLSDTDLKGHALAIKNSRFEGSVSYTHLTLPTKA